MVRTLAATLLLSLGAATNGSAQLFEDHTGDNPPYRLYRPGPAPGQSMALVVLLHGCEQDARIFARVTAMNDRAEAEGFAVLYPEQRATDQPLRCWRWYDPGHRQRGAGEPAAIVGLIDAVRGRPDLAIDGDRVFVAGLSAGGAMTAILAASYPDVFAAAGLVAGVPYASADDCLSAFNVMQRLAARWPWSWWDYQKALAACGFPFNSVLSGIPHPDELGGRVHQAMAGLARVLPVMVFQGSADRTVRPANGRDLIGQWAQANDLADDGLDNDTVDGSPERVADIGVPGGRKARQEIYETDAGRVVMRYIQIDGAGHAWPGGAPGEDYSDPRGPDASALLWAFFEANPGH